MMETLAAEGLAMLGRESVSWSLQKGTVRLEEVTEGTFSPDMEDEISGFDGDDISGYDGG